jgi:hypothetical protein
MGPSLHSDSDSVYSHTATLMAGESVVETPPGTDDRNHPACALQPGLERIPGPLLHTGGGQASHRADLEESSAQTGHGDADRRGPCMPWT